MDDGNVRSVSFGAWLADLRDERGLSQQDVADSAPCTRSHISRIENDKQRPSVALAQRLASVLCLAPAETTLFIQLARQRRHIPATTPQSAPPMQAWVVCLTPPGAAHPARLFRTLAAAIVSHSDATSLP